MHPQRALRAQARDRLPSERKRSTGDRDRGIQYRQLAPGGISKLMPQIYFFVRPTPDWNKLAPFQMLTPRVEMTRVPSLGEVVSLGNDKSGSAADYVVVLVHHCPFRPNGIDAEIYMRRVDIAGEVLRAATYSGETDEVSNEMPTYHGDPEPGMETVIRK